MHSLGSKSRRCSCGPLTREMLRQRAKTFYLMPARLDFPRERIEMKHTLDTSSCDRDLGVALWMKPKLDRGQLGE